MSKTLSVLSGIDNVIIEVLEWDSLILGRRCARIKETEAIHNGRHDFSDLVYKFKEIGVEYVVARRPQGEWQRLHAFQRAGFVVVDGILTFRKALTAMGGDREAVPAGAEDADQLAALAARNFSFSRFHNDPLLTQSQAEQVHAEWVRNSCLGSAADAVWKIESEGVAAGFVTCKIKDGVGEIVLICVAREFAGRGLGLKLMSRACDWFLDKGIKTVQIQTQTHNLAAMALYFKSGFAPYGSSFTLRWAP